MNTRISSIRRSLNYKQDDFAEKLGLTKNFISLIETGKREPSDRTIKDICREFNVNEEWLRTGAGEMFIEIPEEDMYSKAAASLLKEDDALAIEGLKLYYSLSPEQKKAAENFILKLAEAINEKNNKKE